MRIPTEAALNDYRDGHGMWRFYFGGVDRTTPIVLVVYDGIGAIVHSHPVRAMKFTDEDLSKLRIFIDRQDRNCARIGQDFIVEAKIKSLLARLEAAELALEDADCNCRGDNTEHELIDVCRFFKRKEIWQKVREQ